MKYFLKKLAVTAMVGMMGGGLLLGAIHLLDDYAHQMDSIEAEERADKRVKEWKAMAEAQKNNGGNTQ